MINVRDFSAVGDGVTFDTTAIQAAIDSAEDNSTIFFPAGTYLSGSIRLKSNITLHLDEGAKLLAAPDLSYYRRCERQQRYTSLTHYFIGAFGAENISIEGKGKIDAAGENFWEYDGKRHIEHHELTVFSGIPHYTANPERPTTIYLVECKNVSLKDFHINNAPAYTVWLLGCEDFQIDGLTIRNNRLGPNTDAIDIDCCINGHIRNCDIDAGDDCIAIKSDIALLGRDMPCQNIKVSDCKLSSTCCAIRLGYEGDGEIKDCTFKNIYVYDTNKGIDLLALVPRGQRFEIKKGSKIENIHFSDFVMRNVRCPLSGWCGIEENATEKLYGYIKNIYFSNLDIEARDSSYFGDVNMEGLFFDNVKIKMFATDFYKDEIAQRKPNVWGRGYIPGILSFDNVQNVKLNNVILDYVIQE